MNPQEYLENRIKDCTKYKLSEADEKFIKDNSLREFLFKQMTRKKFRRYKLTDLTKEKINEALDYCMSDNKPIIFRLWFGGYKLWRYPTTPEVEWAEFFVLAHYCEFLAPLIATYKPGIKLLFTSDDVFVERLNNIPKSDTDAYYNSFQKLLDEFRKYFPKNFEADMIRHSALYDSEKEFEVDFTEQVTIAKKTWKSSRTLEQIASKFQISKMNIKWDGVEDLTKLSEEDKQKKIEQSIIYHDALVQMPKIRAWGFTPDKIAISNNPFPGGIAIGATKNSIVRFWVGTGVLETKDDTYADRIFSIQQYEDSKDISCQEIKVDFIPLKNFSSVKLYNQKFEFANK
ncbi:MAG: hypothetical protein ACNFW9_00955 [Candidatus Kerfeldbacteria bacterium]